jgi:hypothetical protein
MFLADIIEHLVAEGVFSYEHRVIGETERPLHTMQVTIER